MIAGTYILHLYCDCAACADNRSRAPREFTADTRAEAFYAARKAGWRWNKAKTLAYAPNHAAPPQVPEGGQGGK